MAWVNTNMDTKGNSTIGTDAAKGVASTGDMDTKRIVTKFQDMPAKAGITECSEEKKSGPQGRG